MIEELSSKASEVKMVMIGAIMTGIALVIAQSWGKVIRKSVERLTKYIHCRGKTGDKLNQCNTGGSLFGEYINAVVTTIILSVMAVFIFGRDLSNRMNPQ